MPAITAFEPASTLPTLPVQEVDAAKGYIAGQLAEATRRAYVSDARIFLAWCEARNVNALPAAPEAVATFLAAEAAGGVKYATIARRAAAINFLHASAGLESPTRANLVVATLKGIRRSIGIAPTRKAPATARKLVAMVGCCPDTLQGKRDRALLLLGFGGAFRRSELAAGIAEGPLFRPIGKGGRIQHVALSTKSVGVIVKAYAKAAGFAPADFAGHSLRAGFLTSAAEAGASIIKMCEVSRHKSIDVLRGYVRSAEVFKDHAGAGLL
jgi:site-specific recombinase XerD